MLFKKFLAGVLILTLFLLLPMPTMALGKVPGQFEEILNAQQAHMFAKELEKRVEELRVTDPEYAKKLAEAEQLAAQVFEDKRLHDAEINIRGTGADPDNFSIRATIPWYNLWTGDIMHINNKKFFNIYAMYYSHSGIYNGNNTVYESNSDGVRVRPLSSWQQG